MLHDVLMNVNKPASKTPDSVPSKMLPMATHPLSETLAIGEVGASEQRNPAGGVTGGK